MKIAVLSRGSGNYSTKRLVEAGKKRGHDMVVINHANCNIDIERNKPGILYKNQVIDDVDAIIPRIGQSITSYGSAVVRQFEMMRVYTSVSSLALVRSRDKFRALQLLARSGVGIPRTVFARQSQEPDSLIDVVGGSPVVIKLLEGTHGIGVVLAETRKAAKSVIQAFYGLGASLLVQEFIEEANGADIRVIVVGDRVAGAFMRKNDEDFRSNLHRGGQSLPVELNKKETNIALKAANTLGLPIAGVDIIRSKRGPLVLEVNSSPGLGGIEKQTGEDIAGEIIDYVVQKAKGKRRKDRIGA
ncbi:MAG TPA: 30S ribosomal protein S6--L-glutamate ligase [Candidatus Saccharibacteria bacterium]|nr:30S ribosomal protein S6--L-glutamate ligase [Candidatus Saccharibacteria bacterium]HMT39685.1 30S ribosomal protein S6--L-glutamate ligase [Candidatus Saccharibacteria bacterium]